MAHPSIEKARALLEQREQQEAEHEVWRAAHSPEDFYNNTPPIVRKTYHQQPAQHRAEPRQRDWSAWDRWCEAHIARAAAANGVALVDEILDYVHQELAKRDSEIASLRADLTIATGIQRGEIAEIKRKSDAA